ASHGHYATDKNKSVRQAHRIGTWNVRGLNQPGMEQKDIWILGLSETHWTDSGYSTTDRGNKINFSGHKDEHSKGVAFIVPITVDKFVSGYRPINDSIIVLTLNTVPCRINIIQVYAPTAQSTVEEIENFYSAVTSALKDIPKRESTIVLGDFNAKVGTIRDNEHLRRIVGKYEIGNRIERGERLLQFCSEENFTVTNTCFK
ncbi:endonuclease-reverse transcriptase, partial [Danaus plexippus plexippus]